jgi:predicted nucleic acid-binding protein
VPFAVVLDACVLYPLPLRDTLLRAAQQNLDAVRWSRRILDEVTRNLIEDRRATPEQADSLVEAMERAFEGAEIPKAAIAGREPTMSNDPADRNVLAAAVAAEDVQTIVTLNLRHFPMAACEPFDIDVVHPDAFLCRLHASAPEKVHAALTEQAAALSRPPMTVTEVLDLPAPNVPDFVARVGAG